MADIADKIRALLAHAQSTDNPLEAQAFYAKANELMAKFNIEEDKLGTKHDLRRGSDRFDTSEKWVWIISACAAKLIGVSVLLNDQRQAYFAGRPMNVEMAEELFKHYVDQMTKYYKLALPKGLEKSERGTFRRNFKEGAAQVIWLRVCEIIAQNTKALIVSPVQLDREYEQLTGCAAKPRSRALNIRHNSVGTYAGRVAGNLIELGKKVNG